MKGNPAIAGTILLLILVVIPALPVIARGDTVTRGGTFAVTVAGTPRAAYDIWVKGTHDMSGEPGDQPPVIVPGQVDVQQDDPDGPYPIGSTPIAGGGGTILDDVAPTSAVVPATSYYALVTTDIDGHVTVLFQTSADTATDRQFHIVAQNPANPGEDVQVVLGAPAPAPTPALAPGMPLTSPTTMATLLVPPSITPVPVATAPTTPLPATIPATATLITPSPEETPTETAPVQGIPLPGIIVISAVGIGLLIAAGRKGAG